MADFKFQHIRISGIASAVPSRVVKNEDYYQLFGEEAVNKFAEMTGVQEHRETIQYQTASDLGYTAADRLLNEKEIDRNTIGLLLFGSLSGDYRRPSTSAVLHKRLGLSERCATFDVGLGCSAFVYCIQIASSMLQCSEEKRALIIVGETLSKLSNDQDKSTRMLFGDAGAAILLEKSDGESNIQGKVCTDGKGYQAIIVPAGGFRNMEDSRDIFHWRDDNPRSLYNINMDGRDVFTFTITKVPKTIKEFLNESNQLIEGFDCLAFHQANRFIQQQLIKKLKVDAEKMPLCLDRFGNTSAPAIPLLLSDVYGDDKSKKDLNVLMCGFGVGLSWGVMSAHINANDILPIIESDEVFTEGIIHSPEDML